MRFVCSTCGTEFTVTVHHGPQDARIDWADGPHHCFVCGGEARLMEEPEE